MNALCIALAALFLVPMVIAGCVGFWLGVQRERNARLRAASDPETTLPRWSHDK